MRLLINAGKAYQEGVPVSEYLREMVHDHILQGGPVSGKRGHVGELSATQIRRRNLCFDCESESNNSATRFSREIAQALIRSL